MMRSFLISKTFSLIFGPSIKPIGSSPVIRCYTSALPCRHYTKTAARQSSTIFEITNGVGGSEAMLFASEMLQLYLKYFSHMRWPYKIEEHLESDLGGIKSAKVTISSPASFEGLIQEAGVHRVQRVPKTEKNGRMHTSTVAIAVVPKSVLDIEIKDRDLDIQTMRSSGPGGQHVNKIESAVRITHRPTGIVAECQEQRHQDRNKQIAKQKLLDKLRQVELEMLTTQMTSMRKFQVGHADRNEKIRTYNFPQDRITDHRIGKSYQNLQELFRGDVTLLEKIISDYRNN